MYRTSKHTHTHTMGLRTMSADEGFTFLGLGKNAQLPPALLRDSVVRRSLWYFIYKGTLSTEIILSLAAKCSHVLRMWERTTAWPNWISSWLCGCSSVQDHFTFPNHVYFNGSFSLALIIRCKPGIIEQYYVVIIQVMV